MSSFRAFRWLIAVLLLLSVGWKAAIPPEKADYPEKHLVDFLERNHFDVVVTGETTNYTPIIRATTASCRLQVASLTPDGWNGDLIRHIAADADRSFIVVRGKVYTKQHVLFTIWEDLRSRFLRQLGIASHLSPIIAVAANVSCNAERLPWGELEAVP